MELDPDALTVCIEHGAFVPCRKAGQHFTSQNPYWVKAVRDYQTSRDPNLTWEPASEYAAHPATPGTEPPVSESSDGLSGSSEGITEADTEPRAREDASGAGEVELTDAEASRIVSASISPDRVLSGNNPKDETPDVLLVVVRDIIATRLAAATGAREADVAADHARVEALIETSSLGSAEAKAARESVPHEIGIAIARAATYLGDLKAMTLERDNERAARDLLAAEVERLRIRLAAREADVAARALRDVRGRSIAEWLRLAAEKCCQCTDGHHDQIEYPYGTEDDVHISRDLAREIADALDRADRLAAAQDEEAT